MASLGSPTLDCFRNGSIIQLRSKVAKQNRCLRVLENKEVDSYGRPGFYAGPWVPRVRVWGRWTNGLYYQGQVSGVDMEKVHIQFDDGDKISLDVNDPTAIVKDEVADTMAVQLGSRVIASWPKRKQYYPGSVFDCDRNDSNSHKFFVHFDDGDKGWRTLTEVRPLITAPLASATTPTYLAPGARVWARSSNGNYGSGSVSHNDGYYLYVNMDDGSHLNHDVKEADAVVMDVLPMPQQVFKGSHVLAIWPGRNYAVPSSVIDVNQSNPYAVSYFVRYKNGDQAWANLDQLRLLPLPSKLTVGSRVWCRWQPEYRKFFLGSVIKLDNQIHVKLDDGRHQAHDASEHSSAIALDVVPPASVIKKMTRVIAYRDPQHYRSGFVVEIDKRNPNQVRFEVMFDDTSDKAWVFLDQLRYVLGLDQQNESQFMVQHLGGHQVALRSVKFPSLYLGVEGKKVKAKPLDESCHFNVIETDDHYVKIESKVKAKCCIISNPEGVQQEMDPSKQGPWSYFEVKLVFSPFFQTYKANHNPSSAPPQPCPPGPFPTPGFPTPAPSQPGYPYPGGQVPPPQPGFPFPGGQQPPPQPGYYPSPGGYYPPPGGHPPPPGGYAPPPGGYAPPPYGAPPPGYYPGYGSAPPPQ